MTERMMDKRSIIISMVFGLFGGFIGILPVSLLKTIAVLENDSLWDALNYLSFDHPIVLTVLGVLYNTFLFDVFSFCVYLAIALIGSAVFGYWGGLLSLKKLNKNDNNVEQKTGKGNNLWSFLFGIFYDSIFIFIWLYPGQ